MGERPPSGIETARNPGHQADDMGCTNHAPGHLSLPPPLQPRGCGGIHRDVFLQALRAEGIPAEGPFYEPLYRAPLWHFRSQDFLAFAGSNVDYDQVRCPVAEKAAYDESIWLHHPLLLGDEGDLDDIAGAIGKTVENAGELAGIPRPPHTPRL